MSQQPRKTPAGSGRSEVRSAQRASSKNRSPVENPRKNVRQSSAVPEQDIRTASQAVSRERGLRRLSNLSAAQRGWDEISQEYDTHRGQSWHRSFASDIIEWIPPCTGAKVLDLGCGTGTYALLAAQAVGPTGVVVAVDFSNGMLSRLKEKKAASPNLYRNVLTICHDITELTASEFLQVLKSKYGGFDLITCLACLSVLNGQPELVRQWAAFLKPGGQMVLELPSADNNLNNLYLDVKRSLCHPCEAFKYVRDPDLHALELMVLMAGLELEKSFRTESYNGETYLTEEDSDMALRLTGLKELSSRFGKRRVVNSWARMFFEILDSNGVLCDGFWRSVVISRKKKVEFGGSRRQAGRDEI